MANVGMKLVVVLCSVYGLTYGEKVPESCEGLDNINSSSHLVCSRSEDCLSIDCNVTGGDNGLGAVMILLPCNKLPALQILLKTPSGISTLGVFDSSDPRTTGAPLDDNTEFKISVSWPTTHIATVMSSVEVLQINQPLLQPTNITIPDCVPAATTCLALQQLADHASENLDCTTNDGDNCDTVMCSTEIMQIPVTTQFQVLPCNDTPAIDVVLVAGSVVITDTVVSESQEIELFQSKINVTLDQLDKSIGLKVDLIADGETINVLSYTVIPINKTQCVGDDVPGSGDDVSGSGSSSTICMTMFEFTIVSILLHLLLYV